jgi:alkylated DNA nucleotide flippase Atl1
MREQIIATIRRVPRGYVSTYGAIAKAAGYPGAARQVVRTLHTGIDLPWQRIVGAGGHIKLRGDSAMDQRLRLEMEGVTFRGRRVNMRLHEFHFPSKRKMAVSKTRKPLARTAKSKRSTRR